MRGDTVSIFNDVAVWHRAYWLAQRINTNSDHDLFALHFECDGETHVIYIMGRPLKVVPVIGENIHSDRAYMTTMTIRFEMPGVFVFTATLKSLPHARSVVEIQFDFAEFLDYVLETEADTETIEHIMTICVLYMSGMNESDHLIDM